MKGKGGGAESREDLISCGAVDLGPRGASLSENLKFISIQVLCMRGIARTPHAHPTKHAAPAPPRYKRRHRRPFFPVLKKVQKILHQARVERLARVRGTGLLPASESERQALSLCSVREDQLGPRVVPLSGKKAQETVSWWSSISDFYPEVAVTSAKSRHLPRVTGGNICGARQHQREE